MLQNVVYTISYTETPEFTLPVKRSIFPIILWRTLSKKVIKYFSLLFSFHFLFIINIAPKIPISVIIFEIYIFKALNISASLLALFISGWKITKIPISTAYLFSTEKIAKN